MRLKAKWQNKSKDYEGDMADLDDIKDGKDWGEDTPADVSKFFLKGNLSLPQSMRR